MMPIFTIGPNPGDPLLIESETLQESVEGLCECGRPEHLCTYEEGECDQHGDY